MRAGHGEKSDSFSVSVLDKVDGLFLFCISIKKNVKHFCVVAAVEEVMCARVRVCWWLLSPIQPALLVLTPWYDAGQRSPLVALFKSPYSV